MRRKRINYCLGIICLLMLMFCFLTSAEANIILKIIAANPSGEKTEVVPVKSYLPKEVRPEDVVSKGEFEIGYDYEEALYYVYKDVELGPKESVILEVEIKDVWIIRESRLNKVSDKLEEIMSFLKDTEYYVSSKVLIEDITERLTEIREAQKEEVVNAQKHIARYEKNEGILKEIKENIVTLEELVEGLKEVETEEGQSGTHPL